MCIFKKRKNKKINKPKNDSKTIKALKKEKQKYFDFYDDIKDYTKGKEDW